MLTHVVIGFAFAAADVQLSWMHVDTLKCLKVGRKSNIHTRRVFADTAHSTNLSKYSNVTVNERTAHRSKHWTYLNDIGYLSWSLFPQPPTRGSPNPHHLQSTTRNKASSPNQSH